MQETLETRKFLPHMQVEVQCADSALHSRTQKKLHCKRLRARKSAPRLKMLLLLSVVSVALSSICSIPFSLAVFTSLHFTHPCNVQLRPVIFASSCVLSLFVSIQHIGCIFQKLQPGKVSRKLIHVVLLTLQHFYSSRLTVSVHDSSQFEFYCAL